MGYYFLLLAAFSVVCPFSSVSAAQTYRNVSLGTSLTAGMEGSAWLSPSGDFAVGFRLLNDTGLFLFAVWMDKIPDKTVVWSANGDAPVPAGSNFEVTAGGWLRLTDARGGEIWKRDPSTGSVAYAAMLDSGNFALVSSTFENIWGSFDEPTDTILPGQSFGKGSVLHSRRSETNFTRGRFRLNLQPDGNLVLYPLSIRDQGYHALWASNTVGSGSQLVLPKSGFMYLLDTNNSRLDLASSSAPLAEDLFVRATLGYDGVFRQYVHPRNPTGSGSWPWPWTSLLSLPDNICMRNVDLGGGVCGFNSICIQEGDRPTCSCPSRYSYSDLNDTFSGCKPKFAPPSCSSNGSESGPRPVFEMIQIPNVDWPGSDAEYYDSVSEVFCSESCFSDCNCAAAAYNNGACAKKTYPFSNGRLDFNFGGKALIKVGKDDVTTATTTTTSFPPRRSSQAKGGRDKGKLLPWVLFSSSAGMNCLLLSSIALAVFLLSKKGSRKISPKPDYSGACLMNFTYKELEQITGGFQQILGRGGSGTVYKGALPSSSNSAKPVAVKKLDKAPNEKDQEFRNELRAISKVHHKNLVQLLGYCDEGPHRLLVYEYMSNGSVANYLIASPKPSWLQRIQIAFGVARGLLYLHEECQTQIMHCDIKPQNVLLDDILVARISDFGLSKLLNADQTRTTTRIRGTKGYIAPEWFQSMPITLKVDVYCFGILLLEIICCRRNVEGGADEEAPDILSDWAFDCYREGRMSDLVKEDLEALNDRERLERLIKVAIWCIQEDPSLRPTMWKVIQMLEGAVGVPPPPDPSSYVSSLVAGNKGKSDDASFIGC